MNNIFYKLKNKKLLSLIVLIILGIGTMLTVSYINYVQNITSKADTKKVKMSFLPEKTTIIKNSEITVKILMQTNKKNISGFDVKLSYDPEYLRLDSFNPTDKFTKTLINALDERQGTLRFAAVETENIDHTDDVIEIGSLIFTTRNEGETEIEILNAIVTALGNDQNNVDLTFPKSKINIKNKSYRIRGNIFIDRNNDGKFQKSTELENNINELATLSLSNSDNSYKKDLKPDSKGTYSFTNLPEDSYTLKISLSDQELSEIYDIKSYLTNQRIIFGLDKSCAAVVGLYCTSKDLLNFDIPLSEKE